MRLFDKKISLTLISIDFCIRFVRKSSFGECIEKMAQAKKSYLASPLLDPSADCTSGKQ